MQEKGKEKIIRSLRSHWREPPINHSRQSVPSRSPIKRFLLPSSTDAVHPNSPAARTNHDCRRHHHSWSPSDPSLDPAAVSRLVASADAAISSVAASRLYRRLLLPDSPLHRRLALLGPTRLSLLGVGSFDSSPAARLQLALAALLRRDLLPDAADLFDPVLSAAECAAAAALGFAVPSLDDGCRRRVDEPTLFYMPHCEASLYDALLAANWESPAQLRRFCVLGNSFHRYALQAEENRAGPAAKAAHVLAAERFAWEERIDEAGAVDEADWFSCAFNETSWHFFEVEDEVDLTATTAGGRR